MSSEIGADAPRLRAQGAPDADSPTTPSRARSGDASLPTGRQSSRPTIAAPGRGERPGARSWPLFRLSSSHPGPACSVLPAEVDLEEEAARRLWRPAASNAAIIDMHSVGHSIAFQSLGDFIRTRKYDGIADYDVLYELEVAQDETAIQTVTVATIHRYPTALAGWIAVRRVLGPDPRRIAPPPAIDVLRYQAELSNVFVVPEFRQARIGRALVQTALRDVERDLAILSMRQLPYGRIEPRFHAECVSAGGEALASRFADGMARILVDLTSSPPKAAARGGSQGRPVAPATCSLPLDVDIE